MSENAPPPLLDYSGPAKRRGPHAIVQLFTGAMMWLAAVAMTAGNMWLMGIYGFHLIWFLLLAIIVLDIALRRRHGWTLLAPGVAIGMALSCLIGFGICANAFKHI